MGVGRREFLGWKAVCWEGQARVGRACGKGLGSWGVGGLVVEGGEPLLIAQKLRTVIAHRAPPSRA